MRDQSSRPEISSRIVAALIAILAAGPVAAQVYKWVDDAGATHYSDKAPEKAGPASKLEVVVDRISVYHQDPNLTRLAANSGSNAVLADRVDRLERQLQAERRARQYAAAADTRATMAAYDQCLADRRVDCDNYAGYYPYGGVPVAVVAVRHQHPFTPVAPITGITAGNVVGPGIIPGNFNGPRAVTAGNFTLRTSLGASRTRTF
jgi:hypothetical protein